MTLKQLLHFAYEHCQDNWLFKECEEISNLTATWCYQDLKDEPLANLKIEKLPFSDGSCPEEFIIEAANSQPESLTADDIETIRIHLSAIKEKLCNQRRWKDAEEYENLINRFISFTKQ